MPTDTDTRHESVLQEWLPWSGGICPVDPLSMVEYRLRYRGPDQPTGDEDLVSMAGYLRWDHGRTPESAADESKRRNDIVAYRRAK